MTIFYSVVAPPAATITEPSSGATQPQAVPPAGGAPRTCTSLRNIEIHVLRHLHLPGGVRLVRTEVLLDGRTCTGDPLPY